jgi:sRNA-binding carbon storage regulator CsrA
MLVLTRKPGQAIEIYPAATLSPDSRIRDLFGVGPIHIHVHRIQGCQVKIAIHAHPDLVILRDELNRR